MNANKSAFPLSVAVAPSDELVTSAQVGAGLTKREYFAALAMQSYVQLGNSILNEKVAEWSVQMADALITALNEKQ